MTRRKLSFVSTLLAITALVPAAGLAPSQPTGSPATRSIDVDLRSTLGPTSTTWRRCVGAGRANEGLRADWQRQLRQAKEACGFESIRMHGLLTDDMGVYREEGGKPVYNWQYVDELYDFLVSIRVRPFVELGFMPSALASGNQTIFWWRGNVTPPKDYARWGDLIEALTRHWNQRVGRGEGGKGNLEVWNEPNLSGFWTGDQKAYFHLYEVSAKAIKRVDPTLRVGGPATAGAAWVPEFLAFCTQGHVPVDFVSTHTYGVDVGFLDEFGGRGTVLSRNPEAIVGDVKRVRREIQSSATPRLPLHFTEWSSSYTPTDPVHDSYVSAAYILDKLNAIGDTADSMSYWTFTDVFEEAGPRTTPFHGGFGLINYQDIKKPAFRAYEFLNRLGPTRLKCPEPRTLATCTPDGSAQVLFWDYTNPIPANTNNQQFFITDVKAKPKGSARLRIINLTPGRYRLSVYRVGYRINDPYADYLDLGHPSQITREQVERIKVRNAGKAVATETVLVRKGETLERTLPMRDNDAYLVTATREGSTNQMSAQKIKKR